MCNELNLFDYKIEEAYPIRPENNVQCQNLKVESDKIEKEGIAKSCPEMTVWVHGLVIVTKKYGDLSFGLHLGI